MKHFRKNLLNLILSSLLAVFFILTPNWGFSLNELGNTEVIYETPECNSGVKTRCEGAGTLCDYATAGCLPEPD